MNSVTGLVKPECRVILTNRRLYVTQVRRKKQRKSIFTEVAMFKLLNIDESVSSKYQNPQRVNEFNLQMLSECLYKQLYNSEVQNKPSTVLLEKAKRKLRKYGLGMTGNYQQDVELELPKLRGNLEEHFWSIGDEQSKPYRNLVEKFINTGLPELPEVWVCEPGWTKYTKNNKPVRVNYPDEDALVIDVEVCMKLGKSPTLATAVSSKAWYGWVSPNFVKEPKSNCCNLNLFIPLGSVKKPSIVVGHAVSFDRSLIKEQYDINSTELRFLDTMALHISIGTFTSKRHLITSYITLKELYQLYCNKTLDKENRSVFIVGDLSDIKANFQNLMTYCANDSQATYEVLQVIFPKFLEGFPHPVTLAGMLEMTMSYLPVNQNWNRFVKNSTDAHDDLKNELLTLIARKTDDTCRLIHNNEYRNDLWMWGENWNTPKLKLLNKKTEPKGNVEKFENEEEKQLYGRFKYLFDLEDRLPKKKKLLLPGYPQWYRLLHDKGEFQLSPGKIITAKILRMKWENFPLHYVTNLGWGILIPDIHAKDINTSIPFERLKALAVKNLNLDEKQLDEGKSVAEYYKGDGLWCDHIIDNCCFFYKLRNINCCGRNVKRIFAKEFSLSDATLSSDDTITKRVIQLSEMISFWGECRSSIINELVVWLDENQGVILPRVTVCGNITRHASDKLWLRTIPEGGIGAELRSMVQAPPGYHIIGGHIDLDIWIASLIGDSADLKIHGSTPLGYVTLNGINSSINNIIAKRYNLSVRQAEFLTTCRLSGSGIITTKKRLQRLNPNMTSEEASEIVEKINRLTKGAKLCRMKNSNKVYYIKKAKQLAKARKKLFEDLFFKPFWGGGMESTAHNKLENMISTSRATTPFLSSRLCEALEENMQWKKFGSLVQSSSVDFLHLMLVCMRWLTNGKARYCFSFHSEVRYIIPSNDRYHGALALHVSSLLVKAFCSYKLGMYDLPLSVAFFPTVGIDTTLRKEVRNEYITPSNPHGLSKGYGIPPGEDLDIYDVMEKTGGNLTWLVKK